MSDIPYTKLYFDLPAKDPYTKKLLEIQYDSTSSTDIPSPNYSANRFIALKPDSQLYAFLNTKPPIFSLLYKNTLMKLFKYNLTGANALSGCGEMHVIGRGSWERILEQCGRVDEEMKEFVDWLRNEMQGNQEGTDTDSTSITTPWTWIDCGTGDGSVLSHFLPSHIIQQNLVAIEVNPQMIETLRTKRQAHRVLHFDNDLNGTLNDIVNHVDMSQNRIISLFNVLDRCYRPIQLLKDIHKLISINNQLFIFSVVFPFDPFVECDNGSQDAPEEYLMPRFVSFSHSAHYMLTTCLKDFEVLCWSRVPYCCQGDLYQDYYALDSMLVCCRAKQNVER